MDGIILAFQLFTRVGIKKNVDFSRKNLNTALVCLPFMGLFIGGLSGLVIKVFYGRSPIIGASLGLLIYILLSGGLHLDGLSDMADGFFSNRDKDRILEIMKDSLIGPFGTLSLIVYSILKLSLYMSIFRDQPYLVGAASCFARLSSLYVIWRGNLARPGGFGASIKEAMYLNPKFILVVVLILGLIVVRPYLILSLMGCLLGAEFIRRWSTSKIGGLTGDIYGATIEVGEIIGLLIVWGTLWR